MSKSYPTPEQIESVMRARINAGQEVPAEYQHLREFGYNPSQPRGKGGKWTASQVASAPASAHSTAMKALEGKEHTNEYGTHSLLGQGKQLLKEGRRAEAEHTLLAAAHSASKTADHEVFRQGLSELAGKHGLHALGAYTGSIDGRFMPSPMKHSANPADLYSMPNAHMMSQEAKLAGQKHAYQSKNHKAYEAIHAAAESLYAAHNASLAGQHAKAAKLADKAAKHVNSREFTDASGDTHADIHPHAQALIGTIHENVGYLKSKKH